MTTRYAGIHLVIDDREPQAILRFELPEGAAGPRSVALTLDYPDLARLVAEGADVIGRLGAFHRAEHHRAKGGVSHR